MTISNLMPSIRPSLLLDFANTKQLDPRITFSRASTATSYDGKTVVKAEENLLKYSQEFDNAAWVKTGSAIVANAVSAPDGTTTADKITASATATTTVRVSQASLTTTAGLSYTLSVYALKGEVNFVVLYDATTNKGKYFNLNTGTIGSNEGGSPDSATITAVGGNWYRCSITVTSSTSVAARIYISSTDAVLSYAGNAGEGIYIWGAQLEQRSSVTAYTPTTSSPITNYIHALQTAVSNDARFDHDPVTGESKGLLIEEQRTNLLTYSQDFTNAAWTKTNATITTNIIVAPDGTLTGEKVTENTSAGLHAVSRLGIALSGENAWSVFAKAGERTRIMLDAYNGLSNSFHVFDLSNGTIVQNQSGTATITPVGNGWYRCSANRTAGASSQYALYLVNTGTTVSYTGDGTSGIYIWGAQLEAGAFATSYIPTVASQVTRSADSASMTGSNFSSWFDIAQGTLYGEAYFNNSASYPAIASISDGTNTNRTWLQASGTQIVTANGSTITLGASATSGAFNKYSLSYAASNYGSSNNGAAAATNTLVNVPANETQMLIGSTASGNYIGGTIKRIAYYPARLTNTQLQAITS